MIACLLTGLCIASKTAPFYLLSLSLSAAAELWDVERHGRCRRMDQLMSPLYSHTKKHERWHGSHSCGPVMGTPLQSTDIRAFVTPCQGRQNQPQATHPNYLPYKPRAASAIMLEMPVKQSPPSYVSLPAIRQIIFESSCLPGRAAG